jgi:tetratricopeptide (TPR) repeat protein
MLTFPLWGALFLPSAPSYRELERSLIEREKKEPPGIERPMVEPGLAVEDALYGLIQQGRAAEHQGDTTRAMAAYRRAIDQVAFPLNQLAWLLSLQPQTPEDQRALALPLARLAVQLRPDEAEYLDTLAVVLCRVGEQAEAVQVMAQAAHLEPQKFGAKGARFRQGLCQ